jgi:branched-subunit amino acid permease
VLIYAIVFTLFKQSSHVVSSSIFDLFCQLVLFIERDESLLCFENVGHHDTPSLINHLFNMCCTLCSEPEASIRNRLKPLVPSNGLKTHGQNQN